MVHYTRSHGGLSPLNRAGVTGAQKGTCMKRHRFTLVPLFRVNRPRALATGGGQCFTPRSITRSGGTITPALRASGWPIWNVGEPRTVRMIYFLPNGRTYRF